MPKHIMSRSNNIDFSTTELLDMLDLLGICRYALDTDTDMGAHTKKEKLVTVDALCRKIDNKLDTLL